VNRIPVPGCDYWCRSLILLAFYFMGVCYPPAGASRPSLPANFPKA
jgi:hypothetical protein